MKKIFIYILLFFMATLSYGQESAKYTVYFVLGEDCKICQYYAPLMNELSETYASDSLAFIGLFPNRYSTEQGLADFQSKHGIAFELKREFYGTKTKAFGVTITPEVVVYDEVSERLIYKGRIDNSYHKLGQRRRVVTSSELETVLVQLTAGEQVSVDSVPPIGCYITFNKL